MAIKPNARTSTATARKAAAPAKPAKPAKPAQSAKPAASDKAPRNALNIALTGADKAKRESAFLNIAPIAFAEAQSRGELIATIRKALGKAPSADDLRVARSEYLIGRVTSRLPAFPRGIKSDADKLAYVRELVELKAAPPKDGAKAPSLKSWQTGRRTLVEHKAIRAAEEAWSQVKAELGLGTAQTQSERNAAKRAPAMTGTTARGKATAQAAAPTHSVLVKPEAPKSADDACQHVTMQAAALLAFANKHAGLLPAAFGSAVKAFKASVDKADAERRVTEGAIA